ncbi:hypothetical protein RRG08_011272 [Elysia crispata]|uniref:Uncharacterized protein n=1 Tax=Elysia crispata TaxID=231223 RepID=A0AAE0Y5S8_9GAST|nr:hypothetical protein RRG08_011272 [Elysia crispata]
MFLQMLIIVLIAVTQTHGNYNIYNNGHRSSTRARCSSSAKPCRLMFEMLHLNGTLIHRSSSRQCSCNSYQGPCSNDWTNTNKKISRSLRSDTMIVNLHMMFCRTVTPARVCSNNEVAIETSGSLAIPTNLDHYRCRCSDTSKPLYLQHRRLANNRFYHKYVCGDTWPTCGPSDRCMTVTRTQSTYHCECPSDKRCPLSGSWIPGTIETLVYCSSR